MLQQSTCIPEKKQQTAQMQNADNWHTVRAEHRTLHWLTCDTLLPALGARFKTANKMLNPKLKSEARQGREAMILKRT